MTETYDKVIALLQRRPGKVVLMQLLVRIKDSPQMRIASSDDDLQHRALAALLCVQSSPQHLDISLDVLRWVDVKLLLPPLLQHHQHSVPELVHLELLLHAPGQAIGVALVLEIVLDIPDLGVGAAHETLYQQFTPTAV